ncbi:DUF397 domain-containing protein [Kitasatospora herbaricolor]|uniref:DUF397 domain-containing protein n=1 Tax=Kitasatospora herbaricolor TaxID=68217 RepID=A0ABZ1W5D4_9ACTN|nr:DUF397 domain-containing protein [Kitasatospora herbaricolor]
MSRTEPTSPFRKSSYSAQGGECVEVAGIAGKGQAVRDSKDPDGPILVFPAAAWAAFVAGVKAGEFPAGA